MVDIRTERGKLYGDPQEMHANIATAWTAVLRSRYGQGIPPLDANIAEVMMAAYKLVRTARPVPTDADTLKQWLDSPADCKIFLDFVVESIAVPQSGDPLTLHVHSLAPGERVPTVTRVPLKDDSARVNTALKKELERDNDFGPPVTRVPLARVPKGGKCICHGTGATCCVCGAEDNP